MANHQITRAVWIDQLRILSCLAVVLIHVSGEAYSRVTTGPAWEWWLANILNGSSRAAVPLFVMISGALMKAGDCDPATFYRKKALRLLPVMLAWTALYAVFANLVLGLDAGAIALLFLSKGFVYLHLWYLSMLAFLLVFAPLLARLKFPTGGGENDLRLLVGLCVAVAAIDWGVDFLCQFWAVPFIYWTRTFVEFIPYFLLGLLLSDPRCRPLGARAGSWLVVALAACWTANYLASHFLGMTEDTMPLANRSPLVMAVAVTSFLFVRDGGIPLRDSPWLARLADASFGIYLLHPLFTWFFRRVFRGTPVDPFSGGWMLLTAAAAFGLSAVCIFILRRWALGRKLS